MYNNYSYYKEYLQLLFIFIYVFACSLLYLLQLARLLYNKYPTSIQLELSNYPMKTIVICVSIYLYTYFIQLLNWLNTS